MDEFENKLIISGWLKKKGTRGNIWGDRYFVLKGHSLLYYLKVSDTVRQNFTL